jgi:tRNA(Ile)-lysidine synthase
VESLTQLSQKRFNNLIRYFLAQNKCLMPSTEQLAQLHQQLNADSDKNPVVKVGDNVIRRYKGGLYLTADFTDISDWHTDIVFKEPKIEIELPDNLGKLHFLKKTTLDITASSQRIIMPNVGQKVTIRFNHNNPNCLPDYRNHSRSIKKILQELDIPVWQRKRIPFLYYDDVLVAAIGHFVCQSYVPKLLTPSETLFQEDKPNLIIAWVS